jgi:hypothetical protein
MPAEADARFLAPQLERVAAEPVRARRLRVCAGGLSIAAALVHGVVSGGHVDEWWGYAAFFVVAALAQGIFGLLLLGAPWQYDAAGRYDPVRGAPVARALYTAGIAGTLVLVLVYLVTRTVGIPLLGPDAGEVESVGADGVIAKAYELTLIACLIGLRRATDRSPT